MFIAVHIQKNFLKIIVFSFNLIFKFKEVFKGIQNPSEQKMHRFSAVRLIVILKLSDLFALDINLRGKENNWDIDSQIKLNSLNTDRLSESLRTKITFTKRIDLDSKTDFEAQYKDDEKLNNFLGFVEDSEQIPSNNEFKSKVSLKKKRKIKN